MLRLLRLVPKARKVAQTALSGTSMKIIIDGIRLRKEIIFVDFHTRRWYLKEINGTWTMTPSAKCQLYSDRLYWPRYFTVVQHSVTDIALPSNSLLFFQGNVKSESRYDRRSFASQFWCQALSRAQDQTMLQGNAMKSNHIWGSMCSVFAPILFSPERWY